MGCCLSRVDGAPVGGGGAAVSNVVEQGILVPTIVALTATGSVDVLILSFTGASVQIGTPALATWVTRTNSATLGTTLTILQPGVYAPYLFIPWASGQNLQSAVLLNATLAQRQTTNALAVDTNTFCIGFKFATTIQDTARSQTFTIDSAMIALGRNILSAQVCDISGPIAPPVAASYVNVADTVFRLDRVGDAA